MAMNGFQLFCVEPVTGASSTDTFNVQLLGIKLRSLAKKPLCAMLVAGTFSSWISHGYVEERMKHLKFPMMLLTVFQFSSVAGFSALNSWLSKRGASMAGKSKQEEPQRSRSRSRSGRQGGEGPSSSATKKGHVSIPWYVLLAQVLLVFGSQGISNMANRYLNYPTKIVFKASKLILIMLVGRMFFGKNYHLVEYLATLLLLAGLITINLADADAKTNGGSIVPAFDLGIVFIGISLCADAFIGPLQEYTLQRLHVKLNDMMLYVYCGATTLAVCGLVLEEITTQGRLGAELNELVADGNLVKALSAALLFGTLAFFGNLFVQTLIQQIGVLLTQTTLTIRQFTTICISFIFFPNPFLFQHGVGVALVFSGLIARMLWSNRAEVRRAIAGAPKAVSEKKDN